MKSNDRRQFVKHIAIVALMLNLGVAGVYAQQRPVKMTASGTLGSSALSLQPDTNTDEQNLAGDGTLGPFTFRELHADPAAPQPSSSCFPGRPAKALFSKCGRRGRISIPGRKSFDGQCHGGGIIHLHRSHGWDGPPYHELSDHRWNRAFQGRVRYPDADGELTRGVVQRLWRGRTWNGYGEVYGISLGVAPGQGGQDERQ